MARGPVVHLIDGSVYIFRAYYSLPDMKAPDGTPTHAAYGFANSLLKYLTDKRPSHLAVAFDHSMESFRNEIAPEYKANRDETPADLEPQFDLCVQVSRALGIAAFEAENFEADDVIATLTAQLARKGARVVVVTTDKDLAQVVREDGRVVTHDLARDETRDAAGVREKFGVSPEQIPDYLALMGDSVDNLAGVPGVGAKTAAAALRAFGRIEKIPADAERWNGIGVRGAARAAAAIEEHRERALRTRMLATVRRDVPGIRASLRTLAYRGADPEGVEALFGDLGWGQITTRIPRWAPRGSGASNR
jgi:5'-3' exonuclease